MGEYHATEQDIRHTILLSIKRIDKDYVDDIKNIEQKIANKIPEFDSRNYGFKKLVDLMESTNMFEFKKEDAGYKTKSVYVRCVRARNER